MTIRNRLSIAICALTALLSVLPLSPAVSTSGVGQQYQPEVGQEGKDVVWVPTPEALVSKMLDLAKVTPDDYVIDLGSGDGRIVIAAARRGAKALGIEYNPDMVALSRLNAEKAGVTGRASFEQADIFQTDFSKATVLTMYLLPDLNLKLRPKILDLKPGTRVVTNAFTMGDWEADSTAEVEGRTANLWIVPAKVSGTWTWPTPGGTAELALRQTYQKIEGSLRVGARVVSIQDAKLQGDQLSFAVKEGNPSVRRYSGRVRGSIIAGSAKLADEPGGQWTAQLRPDK